MTTSPAVIRKWAESRGAKPACVRGTGGGDDVGLLRLDLPGFGGGDSLEEITWEEFFQKFEEQNLAFTFQEKTAAGKPSNFNKLVRRDESSQGSRKATSSSSKTGQSSKAGRSSSKTSQSSSGRGGKRSSGRSGR